MPHQLLFSCVLGIATMACQSSTSRSQQPSNATGGYWADPTTGLWWVDKDNGKDVNWHEAARYCESLRLAGFADWRMPTINELEGIFDKNALSPGLIPKSQGHGNWPTSFHVKGNLFLTGEPWSTSHKVDLRGDAFPLVWLFDFVTGRRPDDDSSRFSGSGAVFAKRALCAREPKV